MKKRKKFSLGKKFLVVILLIISVVLYGYIFDQKIDMNGDNAAYFSLAVALSEFKGYVDAIGLEYTPHSHFPPGYPFILAPFMWISKNILFIKSISGLFYFTTVVMSFLVLDKLRPQKLIENFFISILIAFNFHLLKYSTIMMSEIALIVSNIFFFFLLIKKSKQEDTWKQDGLLIGLAFTGMLAYHIKTLALPIIGAGIFYFLWNKKFKTVVSLLGWNFVFFLPFYIRNKIVGVSGGYTQELIKVNPYRPELGDLDFVGFLNRLEFNFLRYLGKELPHGLLTFKEVEAQGIPDFINYLAGGLIVILVLLGWYSLKKYKEFLLVYIPGTFAILLMWPEVWYGIRFMVSLLPFLIILASLGIYFILEKIKGEKLFIPLLLVITIWQTGEFQKDALQKPTTKFLHAYRNSDYPPAFKNYVELAKWASFNLPKGSLVACRKPEIFHLFYKGPAGGYPHTENQQEFLEGMKTSKSKYLVIDQLGYSSTARFAVPAIQNNPDYFKFVHKIDQPETYIFEYVNH